MKFIIRQIYDESFEEKPGETPIQLLHRQNIAELACFYGLDRCTHNAQTLYREWMADKGQNK